MDEQKVYEYTYTTDSNGNRILDKESDKKRMDEYLVNGGLDPEKFLLGKKSRHGLYKIIAEKIKGKYDEPKIFIGEKDMYRDVFATVLLQTGLWESKKKGEKARYPYYKVIDISYVTQQQISGEYHDPSLEFDNIVVLLVKLNYTDVPNYLNAYCIRNLAEARKGKGLYTFFFFRGTTNEFGANKWKLDENGDGQRGIIRRDDNVIDTRSFIPLTRYIDCIDLNVAMKNGGGKK